jgi:hypothetical protein
MIQNELRLSDLLESRGDIDGISFLRIDQRTRNV